MAVPRSIVLTGCGAALAVCLTTTSGAAGASTASAPVVHAKARAFDGRILFSDFKDGQIYTVNPDGTAPVQVTHRRHGRYADWGDWSPDSRRIVFDGDIADGTTRIFMVRADGSHLHQVGDDTAGVYQLTPRYTPDGGHILFSRCLPDPPGGCAIYTMRADGTGARPLTHYRTGVQQGVDITPEPSPGGHRIAFTRFDSGGYLSRVVVMRSNGSHEHTILPASLNAAFATWAPHGDRVVFMDNISHLGSALHLADSHGSHLRSLTRTQAPHNDGVPTFSPSGRSVAFRSDRGRAPLSGNQLRVIGADGRGDHLVRTGFHQIFFIDWGSAPLQTASPPSAPRAEQSLSPGHRRGLAGLPGGLVGEPGVFRR